MDKGEAYIKMCGCEEIQDARPNEYFEKDYFYDTRYEAETARRGVETVWLPRQDQLQGMVNGIFEESDIDGTWLILANRLNKFIQWWDSGRPARGKFKTMEQLWLAFVMREKFGKTWVNGEWK